MQAVHPSNDGLRMHRLQVRHSLLQMFKSKCFRMATSAPWYTGNKNIHNDLGVPLRTMSDFSLKDSTQSYLMWGTS